MSTNSRAIAAELAQMLVAQLAADANAKSTTRIDGTTDLNRDLGLESAQIMEFVVEVEDHYDISIALEHLSRARTIEDLAEIVAAERTKP